MKNNYRNILIVRTDRIGDVVLTLPLARLIKKHYPNSKVTFLVRDYTKSILNNHPFIDDTIILKEKDGNVVFFDNLATISSHKFDVCIVVYPNFITSLLVFLSGIKKRVGTGYRWYSFLFNEKLFEHRKYAQKHELEYNVNLLKKLDIEEDISIENVKYDLIVENSLLKKIQTQLTEIDIDLQKQFIVVHPGSKGSSMDLPIAKFKELVKKLSDDNLTILLTGSTAEVEICNQLVINDKVKNLAGKFNLDELIALISKADVFISNSTGPMHIAAALGKITVGFYPKIVSCSKERWGPYTANKLVYVPQIDCNNCTREQCEKLDCMNSIDMNIVFKDIKNILVKL